MIARSACAACLCLGLAAPALAQRVDDKGYYADPFLVLDPGMHTAQINAMDADAAGRFLATASDDKTVRIWSVADGTLLRTIHLPAGPGNVGKAHSVALSPDGKFVAAGGFTGPDNGDGQPIYLFDRASGQLLSRTASQPGNAEALAISPDARTLGASLADKGMRLFALPDLSLLAADTEYGNQSYGLAFAPGGRIVTSSLDGKIRLYHWNGSALQRIAEQPTGGQPFRVAVSPNGKHVAVGYNDAPRVDILSATTLKTEQRPDVSNTKNNLSVVDWARDGRTIYAGGMWFDSSSRVTVRAWQFPGTKTYRDVPAFNDTVGDIRSFSDGSFAVAAATPEIALLARSGQTLWQHSAFGLTFNESRSDGLLVSQDGEVVYFRPRAFSDTSGLVFNVVQRSVIIAKSPPPELNAPNTTALNITNWRDNGKPNLDAKTLVLDDFEESDSLAVSPDKSTFILGTSFDLRKFDKTGLLQWQIPVPDVAWHVNISADSRLVVAALGDGSIRWYRFDTGAELMALYTNPDGTRWVAWTPLGYYMASPGGEDLIKWQVNHGLDRAPDIYDASRFRDQFYRPDVVQRVLDTLDPQKALDEANRAAGHAPPVPRLQDQTPPRVAIIDPADNTDLHAASTTIGYTVQDNPGTPIRSLRLLQDGVVIAEQHDLTIPKTGRLTADLPITLRGETPPTDTPRLTLIASTEKGASDPATIRVHFATDRQSAKPDLYALVVGISHFSNAPALNLRYAADDATAIAARLRKQEGRLYHKVYIRPLTDQGATHDAIDDGLEWVERQMTSKDVAVLYLSTHGTNDTHGNLYLLPEDVDTRDEIRLRRTGLRYAELQDTVSRLADRGKTLVFLDACHSGNVIPGAKGFTQLDMDKLSSELASAENGAVVFSSSTGSELSQENDAYRHGNFTEALLEALDGKSDLPTPTLHVAELGNWLRERVKTLTNGAQHPTVNVPESRLTDPVVFIAQPASP